MYLDTRPGSLTEPLTGRSWDQETVLLQASARVSLFRETGVSNRTTVFLHHGNTLEFFVDLLAVWLLGGCAVPIDPRKTRHEVEIMALAATPRLSLWLGPPDESISERMAGMGIRVLDSLEVTAAASRQPGGILRGGTSALDDPALILFTSGTTGDPKGVVHTHRSLLARWSGLRQALGTEPFRRTLCPLPTHFGHGLICNCLFPWFSGQDLFILPPSRTEAIVHLGSILDENGITFMSSVPSLWRLALKTAKPPRRNMLERVFCGSAPLTASLWKDIREWTGARDVRNVYGITETGSWIAGIPAGGFLPEDGLVGEPWGAVIRILDGSGTDSHPRSLRECSTGESGNVWVHTASLMKGYLGRDDLTRKVVSHGWFSTGDIGMIDDRGLLYLKGRERDEINKGGMKIYPVDIDAVAGSHDAVADVCAFGFEEPLLGEDVGIALVLKENSPEKLRAVADRLRDRVGARQFPKRWYVLDQIPRNPFGKVDRARVAKICESREAVDLRMLYR